MPLKKRQCATFSTAPPLLRNVGTVADHVGGSAQCALRRAGATASGAATRVDQRVTTSRRKSTRGARQATYPRRNTPLPRPHPPSSAFPTSVAPSETRIYIRVTFLPRPFVLSRLNWASRDDDRENNETKETGCPAEPGRRTKAARKASSGLGGDGGGRSDVTDRSLGNRHHVPHGQRQPGRPQRSSARPRGKAGNVRTRNGKPRRAANTKDSSGQALRSTRSVGSLPIIDATPMCYGRN